METHFDRFDMKVLLQVLIFLTTRQLASSLDIVTLDFYPEIGNKSLNDNPFNVSTNPGDY